MLLKEKLGGWQRGKNGSLVVSEVLNFKSMKTVPLKGSVGHTDSAEWGEAAEEPTDPIHCTRISKCKRSNEP